MIKSNLLPSAEQFDIFLEQMRILTNQTVPTDFYGTPGPKRLMFGDNQCGFYGFVQPSEFGNIGSNPFNAANLASTVGISEGTLINNNVPWCKFAWKGRILFIPLKPIRYGVTWREIYRAGSVYGVNNPGYAPLGARVGRSVSLTSNNQINIGGTPNIAVDVGGVIVTKGFNIPTNNGRWIVTAVNSENTIYTVQAESSGANLQNESGVETAVVYNAANEVTQNKRVNLQGHVFAVRLIKGANGDFVTTTDNAQGQSTIVPGSIVGANNEWNNLILGLHFKAKTKTWITPGNVGEIKDLGLNLTDSDLGTATSIGGFTICQEPISTSGNEAVFSGSNRKLVRGWNNNSGDAGSALFRAITDTSNAGGWRPVLELVYE